MKVGDRVTVYREGEPIGSGIVLYVAHSFADIRLDNLNHAYAFEYSKFFILPEEAPEYDENKTHSGDMPFDISNEIPLDKIGT